ncbi:Trypanosome variant surface glycoprotein (A-type), putative [Trypanosoma equiperdum]|uniref:Trypanosome variant surface glycoprotein (A-type), putative n=1 Tax=Trypanosoma equiperdum TaxID=5694 RepID=A0A1G4I5J8_TRYEQ|nr:Trypanosome variant surface glycoprotein (A-type), putative [Trypanosoma equiperdum]
MNLLRLMSAGGTTGTCIRGTSDNAPKKMKNVQALGCPPDILEENGDDIQLEPAEVTASGFAKFKGNSGKGAGDIAKCHLLATNVGGDSAGHLWQTQTPGPQTVLLGLMTLTPHSTPAQTDNTFANLQQIASKFRAHDASEATGKLYNVLVALQTEDIRGCGETSQAVIKHVIKQGKVKGLIPAVRKNAKLTTPGTKADHGAEDMQKSVAGQDSEQEKKNLR